MTLAKSWAASVLLAGTFLGYSRWSLAQTPTPDSKPAAAIDPALTVARSLIGEALFLRGFYASNELRFNVAGRVEDASPARRLETVDWTLAAINVLDATRRGPDQIALDGVRAAIRYNPDAHEFQRHPLGDGNGNQKAQFLVRVVNSAPGPSAPGAPTPGSQPDQEASARLESARQLRAALAAIFSVGIDPGLEHSMPPLWSHYFDPSLAWPPDQLTGQTVYLMAGQPGQPQEVTPPRLAHRVDAHFTDAAVRDNVRGQVVLRVAVDAEGVPGRTVVLRPLGYGLDQEAAEAVTKWRFDPAARAGQPVVAAITVNLDFEATPAR